MLGHDIGGFELTKRLGTQVSVEDARQPVLKPGPVVEANAGNERMIAADCLLVNAVLELRPESMPGQRAATCRMSIPRKKALSE